MERITNLLPRSGTQTSTVVPGFKKTLLKSGDPQPQETFVPRQRSELNNQFVGLTTAQDIRPLQGLGRSARLACSTGYFVPACLKRVIAQPAGRPTDWRMQYDRKSQLIGNTTAAGHRAEWMAHAEKAVKPPAATPTPASTPTLAQREASWLAAAQHDRQPALAPQPKQATRKAALARDALVTQLRTELAQARATKPPNTAQIQQCACAALKACLPELFASEDEGVRAAMQNTLEPLMALDALLAAEKTPGYSMDRMLDVVCNFGSIRNLGDTPTAHSMASAFNELRDALNSMLGALTPPRDGADLDHLVGLSTELDAALLAARVTATATLLGGNAVESKTNSPPGSQAQAHADATTLVQMQFDIARTRLRLQNTLRTEGIAPPTDSLLIRPLDTDRVRRQLGHNADKVELILNAIKIQQDTLMASPQAEKLRDAIDATLNVLGPSGRDEPTDHLNMVYLVGRLRVLPPPRRSHEHVIDIKDPQDTKYPGGDVIDIKTPPEPKPKPAGTSAADQLTLRLVRDGMTSQSGTQQAYQVMNNVMAQARPQLAGFDVAIVTGGKDEDKAQRLGDALLRRLLNRPDDAQISVKTAHQPAMAQALKSAIGKRLDDCKFTVATGKTQELQEDIAALSDELVRLDGIKASSRAVLHDYGIDAERPRGLRSCVKVREALRCLQEIETGGGRAQAAGIELDLLCGELRDFNPRTLKTHIVITNGPRTVPFTRAYLTKLASDPQFVQAVEALITIRESDAHEAGLLKQLAVGLNIMDRQLADRRAAMGEADHAVLRDTVRAAILHVAAGSTSLCWFQPADKAKEIRDVLGKWGVPVDTLKPEIDAMLSESFGPDELNVWLNETGDPQPIQTVQAPDGKGTESHGIESKEAQQEPGMLTEKDEVELTPQDLLVPDGEQLFTPTQRAHEDARQTLIDSIDRLQLSTRVRLTGGTRVALNSGSISLGPGSPVGLGGRLVGSQVLALEVGRGADAYEIVMRTGKDVRGGLTGIHNLGSIPGIPVTPKAEGVWSADGVGNWNGGVVLRSPNDDKGRELMKKALAVLIDKNPIEPGDLPEGINVCKFDEKRGLGKAGGGARLGVEARLSEAAGLGKQGTSTGTLPAFMGSARLAGAVQYQYTKQKAMSPNGGVLRTFAETTGELTLGGVGTLRTGSKIMSGKHSASGDAIEAGGWAGRTVRDRTKVVLDANGMVIGSTEIDTQVFLPLRGRGAILASTPPEFRKLMAELEKSKAPDRQRLASDLKALINSVKTNQMFSVVSGLDPRVAAAINRKQSEANALRMGMIPTRTRAEAAQRAKQLEDQAKAMLADKGNYMIHRVRVMDQYDKLGSKTYIDLGMLRVSSVDEHQGITPVADARPTPDLAREIHDLEPVPEPVPALENSPDQGNFNPEIGSKVRDDKDGTGTRSGKKAPFIQDKPPSDESEPLLPRDFDHKGTAGATEAPDTQSPVTFHITPGNTPVKGASRLHDTKKSGGPERAV